MHAKIGKGGRERGERERAGRGQKAGRDGTGRDGSTRDERKVSRGLEKEGVGRARKEKERPECEEK